MKQSWLARNLVMNFVIIFSLLLTQIIDWELLPSMILAYFFSDIVGGFLFKVPAFIQPNAPPVLKEISWEYVCYALIPATITGVITSEIIRIVSTFKVPESQAIVFVLLANNLILATMDNYIAKRVK